MSAQHSRQINACGEVKPVQVRECGSEEPGKEKPAPYLYLKQGKGSLT